MGQAIQMQLGDEQMQAAEREFLRREAASRDTIDVKRCYIDVAGGVVEGVLLAQIVYWFLPARDGSYKTTITRRGCRWIAKQRGDWWEECRISEKVYDRAIKVLEARGLVMVQLFRRGGTPTPHIALCMDVLMRAMDAVIQEPPSRSDFTQRAKSISPVGGNRILPNGGNHSTEITSETTAEITTPVAPLQGAMRIVMTPGPTQESWAQRAFAEGNGQSANYAKGKSVEEKPCLDCDDGRCTMNCGPAVKNAERVPTSGEVLLGDPAELAGEVQRVMLECGLTNPRLGKVIAMQMRCELRLKPDKNCAGVAAEMIEAWAEYRRCNHLLRVTVGARKFFEEGLWRGTGWAFDKELVERNRRVG